MESPKWPGATDESSGTDTDTPPKTSLACEDADIATLPVIAEGIQPTGNAALTSPSATEPVEAAASAAAPEEGRTSLQTSIIMLALCSALFLAALDVTIVTVAIPTISNEFNSTVGYTWIGSAYLLANAAAAPSWGKISDIWGRKQVLLIAVAIFWLGSLLSGTSVSMAMLIAARAIQGVGGGGIIVLVNVCISDLFSLRKRGKYFGLVALVWALSGGIGPIIGGAFTTHVSWRWCFYINLPISGVCFFFLAFVLKLHNPRTGLLEGLAAVDWAGTLTIVGGTLMILLGLTFGNVVYPWRSATVICLLVFGFVVVGLFIVIEAYFSRIPVMPMRLFKSRAAIAAFTCCFFHGLVYISGSYYLPTYFQAVVGASPLMSGVYVLPFSILISASSAVTGFTILKTGKFQVLIVAGFVILTFGFSLFTILGAKIEWARCIIIQIVAAVGIGLNFQSPLIALQATVQQRDIATATATFGFTRQLATAISVVIGGVVFQNTMQQQHQSLVASIGEETANLFTGSNAASSVYIIKDLDDTAKVFVREAYWKSLRAMYIMFAALAGVGLFVSFFTQQKTLSTVLEERKTGLHNMEENEKEKKADTTRVIGDVEQGIITEGAE
ncbi:major facilitator superfamily transporter [Grosmannia clavigera kw1407]|uniref:Efflux pump dotC n=1 Tax=Grosmannia clavigera (strain kw1407 / UAMH 11150) TaxID=655863 RepID=F0XCW6_GROCL|nr:major facilitator superfamily transporter [Grosmannia clavigera kw1407]EFX03793.1 major facilitator superfamily transporter [Grosmannia clavigera kw1407]